MFAFPRSFFLISLCCAFIFFLADDEMQERLYDSLLFFLFFSSSSPSLLLFLSVLTIRRRLLHHHHHHQLQDDQINAVYTNSIVFSFFFSIRRRLCSCGEVSFSVYIYIDNVYVFSCLDTKRLTSTFIRIFKGIVASSLRLLFDICQQNEVKFRVFLLLKVKSFVFA